MLMYHLEGPIHWQEEVSFADAIYATQEIIAKYLRDGSSKM